MFVDFESGLNTAAKRLRAALSDSADQPVYIETVTRAAGYEFQDRDRGKPHGSAPPTPPDMRVRSRRFGGLSDRLHRQSWNPERGKISSSSLFYVGNGMGSLPEIK